ncbi:MAG: AAA family ATPase, partial [Candidatus Dormiibacterota bacterium]
MADLGPPRPPLPATGEGPLLERQREVTLLDALIEEARVGAGRVALIEGEAGIGKSRLLGEARARATAQHFRVLAARASELEREFAFAVVRRLFEPIVTGPLGSPWLAGSAGPAAAVFEPLGTSSDANAGTNWFATLDGLYRLAVDAAAEAPLLLEIDDIQWCDRPSLRFLAYLVHRLDGLPALVAVGLRAAEPGSDAMLLGEIVHDAATASIYPAPLSEVASAALFRTRLGAEP